MGKSMPPPIPPKKFAKGNIAKLNKNRNDVAAAQHPIDDNNHKAIVASNNNATSQLNIVINHVREHQNALLTTENASSNESQQNLYTDNDNGKGHCAMQQDNSSAVTSVDENGASGFHNNNNEKLNSDSLSGASIAKNTEKPTGSSKTLNGMIIIC